MDALKGFECSVDVKVLICSHCAGEQKCFKCMYESE